MRIYAITQRETSSSAKSHSDMKHSTPKTKKKLKPVDLSDSVDQMTDQYEVNEQTKSKKRSFIPMLLKTILIVSFCTWIFGIVISSWAFSSLFHTFRSEIHAFISQVEHPSIKQTNGRTNILLLGIGGGDHEAPELTDTIQIFSFHPQTHLSLMSLPRDVWSDSLQDRINTAYYYGNAQQREGGGLELAKQTIEEIVGMPIHYGVVINFEGFKEIIDMVGGIDVSIEKGFSDSKFPIKGKEQDMCNGDPLLSCRYKTVTFTEGIEHMDGERALTYVRSRHATGDEGTDFDRGRRQQEVFTALAKRLETPQQWVTYDSVERFMDIMQRNIKTDITVEDAVGLGLLGGPLYQDAIQQISLESQFMHPDNKLYGGRYVLIPIGTNNDLKQYVQEKLNE
jgi:LCP family protein required for cell wall assembly